MVIIDSDDIDGENGSKFEDRGQKAGCIGSENRLHGWQKGY